MDKLKLNQKGFGAVEVLLIFLTIGVIGFGGYYVYSHSKNSSNNNSTTLSTPGPSSITTQLKTYRITNEGLSFSYNPKTTTITTQKPNNENDLYVEYVKAKTGLVTLSITAGISGIGGGPSCTSDERGTCVVVDTLKSTFLNKPITYRLIKANQVQQCGYAGVPSCSVAPLVTSFLLDTYDKTDVYGPCCGTIDAKARNTGQKAKYAGDLLVTIEPAMQIQNKELLTNKDFLDTIKIIESIHY